MNLPAQTGYGVDVSIWQNPAQLALLQGRIDFVYARASHGVTSDPKFIQMVAAARDIGAKVGAYHFFENDQPVNEQLRAFAVQLDAAGIRPGDLCPAIDLERNGSGAQVAPSWSIKAAMLSDLFVQSWGECLIYISPSIWGYLGHPAWILERPLWLAQYSAQAIPDAPKTPLLWQHRVGPFAHNGPGGYLPGNGLAIDQSRAYGAIPTIPATIPAPPPEAFPLEQA